MRRFAETDIALFEKMSARADALADDPLQAAIMFIKLFEDELNSLPEPFPGCMLASYVYDSGQFDPEVREFTAAVFRRWSMYFEKKFEQVMAIRKPKIDVTAHDLAEMIVSIYEGSFILSRAHHKPEIIIRQSELFRQHLGLVFAD